MLTSENTCLQGRLAHFTAMADKVNASRQRYDAIRADLTDPADIEATFVEQIVEQDQLAALALASLSALTLTVKIYLSSGG